jgi:hypothetical protein
MSKSIQPDALLFECFAENRHFRIYASGRTEGFEGRVLVVNHFIRRCADLLSGEEGQTVAHKERTQPLPPDQEITSPSLG